jgi:acyl dehydratase
MDALESLFPRAEIADVAYEITAEKIAVYSRYVFDGEDRRNIHTDDEVARRAGLARAVAQGRYPIGYISERMVDLFGIHWFSHGRLDLKLARPIYPGDRITVKCRLVNREREGAAIRVTLDVWLENQHGERATVGCASCLIPAAPTDHMPA